MTGRREHDQVGDRSDRDQVWAIADGYVAALAVHEPDAAQALGRDNGPLLADIGPAWLLERYALQRRTLADLDALPPAAGDETLRAALRERVERERLLFDTGFTTRLVAGLASPVHLIRYSFEGAQLTPDAASVRLVARLRAVPRAIGQYIDTLRWSRAQGLAGRFSGTGVAPVRQIDTLAAQVEAWAADDWFGSLTVLEGADAAHRADFRAAAEEANTALRGLTEFLREDLRPSAPTADGVGEAVYGDLAAAMLGARIDVADTYAFGWRELERLTDEATLLASPLGGTGADPVRSAADILDSDPRYRLEGIDAIREWLTLRVHETIDAVSGTAFDLPPAVRDVECIVSPSSAGVVYYTPSPPDGSEPGRIVWTIPSGVPAAATWQEVSSVHHEGVPGHHLEHVMNASNLGLHPWQRHLCHIHGYAEGWAHYAEQLADELGLIRDDAERLGLVLGQIWRAVRIVADIGLHTGWGIPSNTLIDDVEWTPEVARRLLVERALVEPALARFEVDRYLGWPGQALAFKVGARLWHDARDAWAAERGDAFTLRDFHREALGFGPMGLGPLRRLLLRD
ncbi:DUF885 domain-containing protein [Micromonospora sp. DT81.3]|uniref:DUF885 domain-containing protein n=1 Tax=Micromonospora sp. DT81.3 TaxID=3416523 RepID=UPI003CE7FD08